MQIGKTQKVLLLTTLLTLAVAVPFNVGTLAALGKGGIALAASVLRDPAALIAGRSPGDRGNDLIQSKPALRAVESSGPQERVLDEVRTRPAGVPPVPAASAPADTIDIGPTPDDRIPVGLITGSSLPEQIAGVPDGSPLLPPPPLAGGALPPSTGGGSGGGGTVPPPAIEPVSPVPEPSTWVLLLSGFFAVGVGLRREKRRQFLNS